MRSFIGQDGAVGVKKMKFDAWQISEIQPGIFCGADRACTMTLKKTAPSLTTAHST
ncbi:hypothetical protein ACU8KI_16650 [Rhizobium leguminosarum]